MSQLIEGELFVVGGIVRDRLFNHFHGMTFRPKDVDLATSLNPDEVLSRLRSAKARSLKIKTLEIGKSFGVVAAVFPSGETYEIATFRSEWYDPEDGDGRRPDHVEFSTPEIDAQRRDLTINALFYNIENKEVVDYVGGIQDVEDIVIRPVGDPSLRYQEDRLRILRTVRFSCRYKDVPNILDALDKETLAAIDKWKGLPGVSPERIAVEFQSGIKQAIHVEQYLHSLHCLDLFPAMFPDMEVDPSMVLEADSRNANVVMAKIFPEGGINPKGMHKKLISLKYDGEAAHRVQFLCSLFAFHPENVYSFLKSRDRFEFSMLEDVRELCRCTGLDSAEMEKFMLFQPTVTAADFPDLEEGPLLGQAIREGIRKEYAECRSHSLGFCDSKDGKEG